MRLLIVHETVYRYDADVFIEPHYLRFEPQPTAWASLDSFALDIEPEPIGVRKLRDEQGNGVHFAWFAGTASSLTIRAASEVTIHDFNPFAFVFSPAGFGELPARYEPDRVVLLRAYLEQVGLGEFVEAFGDELLRRRGPGTMDFLLGLTQSIHEEFELIYREVGPPLEPAETFATRRGSCRDLTWLMIDLLRRLGLAARFVSGYFYFHMEPPAYELHAWVEVYLPGAGWFGLDPSHGIATGNAHIPLACGSDPAHTMPVSGSIRGSATAELASTLHISPP